MNQNDTQRVLLDSKDISMMKNSIWVEDAAMVMSSHRPNSLGWASGDGGFDASSAGQGFTKYGKIQTNVVTGFPEIGVSTSAKRATFESKYGSSTSAGL